MEIVVQYMPDLTENRIVSTVKSSTNANDRSFFAPVASFCLIKLEISFMWKQIQSAHGWHSSQQEITYGSHVQTHSIPFTYARIRYNLHELEFFSK